MRVVFRGTDDEEIESENLRDIENKADCELCTATEREGGREGKQKVQ